MCSHRNSGPCRVTIDGRDKGIVTGNGIIRGPSILLYQDGDLDPRVAHTVTITVVEENTVPNDCSLDYFA